jgi:hypothetical protein
VVAKILRRQRFRRKLGPGDQCPILVQRERHDGLIDFERVLRRLVGAIQKIHLVAERQCDLTGRRVFRILRSSVSLTGVGVWARVWAPHNAAVARKILARLFI